MKIRLKILFALVFIGLQASQDSEYNSLGAFYPDRGNPLISVKLWQEGKSTIEEKIRVFFIAQEKWPTGNFVYNISQQWNGKAKVLNVFFDAQTIRYQEKKIYPDNLCESKDLSQLSLDNCSYVVCLLEKLDYNFLSPCADFINKAHQRGIAVALHFSYLTSDRDRRIMLTALTGNKEYKVIDDKETDFKNTQPREISVQRGVEQVNSKFHSKKEIITAGNPLADLIFIMLGISMLLVCFVPLIAIFTGKVKIV